MKTLLLTLFILFSTAQLSLQAQKFLRPFETFSHSLPAYITLEDGVEFECTIKKIERKKGLIETIYVSTATEKKREIAIETIKHAYLPQSGWDKMIDFNDVIYSANRWEDGLYDKERIKAGYAYFEKATVIVKDKESTMLMQLLNPHGSARIKVYHDPFATETMGVGVAGIQLTGGDDRSYYISKDGATAYKYTKKEFRTDFKGLFGDCQSVLDTYGKSAWSEFEKIMFNYNYTCSK